MISRPLLLLLVVGLTAPSGFADSPAQIYQSRILPLLKSGSNSCAECHLSGIDLRSVLSTDQAETFAALRARGWIDVDAPEKSKLLEFVARHSKHSTDLARRVRKAEHQAISHWLRAACEDPALLQQSISVPTDLDLDESLIRHGRVDQLTRRFTIAIWSQLERCANCHSPDRNAKKVQEHGEQMSWIVPNQPGETLELLLQRKLIDLDVPEDSLLRTKPTGIVEHGAGTKFPVDGQTDEIWIAFLSDYAKTVRGQYRSASELPSIDSVHRWRSGLHLRITGLPRSWAESLYSVTLHRTLPDGSFAATPSATAECYVTPERLQWGNSLVLIDPRESVPEVDRIAPIELADALPRGTYQLRLSRHRNEQPSQPEMVAETTIEAPWTSGHSAAATVDFASLRLTDFAKPPAE